MRLPGPKRWHLLRVRGVALLMKENLDRKASGKLELIAAKSFAPDSEMYRVIDFLNKSLKERNLMFGLAKDRENGMMVITIYEV
jgi:hypothetical protein